MWRNVSPHSLLTRMWNGVATLDTPESTSDPNLRCVSKRISNVYPHVFTAALFIRTEERKRPKCPPTAKWRKNCDWLSRAKEGMPAVPQLDVEDIRRSERSRRERPQVVWCHVFDASRTGRSVEIGSRSVVAGWRRNGECLLLGTEFWGDDENLLQSDRAGVAHVGMYWKPLNCVSWKGECYGMWIKSAELYHKTEITVVTVLCDYWAHLCLWYTPQWKCPWDDRLPPRFPRVSGVPAQLPLRVVTLLIQSTSTPTHTHTHRHTPTVSPAGCKGLKIGVSLGPSGTGHGSQGVCALPPAFSVCVQEKSVYPM